MVPVPTAAKTKKRPRKSGEGGLVANFRYDLKNNKGLLGLTLPAEYQDAQDVSAA